MFARCAGSSIYIEIRFPYIFLALSEQQKIDSGWFLFEAERKAKKAKKDIVENRKLLQPKPCNIGNTEKEILEISDDSTITDDSHDH